MNSKRLGLMAGCLAAVVGVSACDELLTVQDPQRYTNEDLDGALEAVANGVEGAIHEVMDTYVVYQSLLSDVYQHTGTWNGYDEVDHGRFQYGTSAMDGTMNSFLRARWFAGSAEERFNRVLGESEAASSPLMAQVHLASAVADLYLGQAYCEAPIEDDGPAVPDTQVLQQAVTKFTRAISTAQAAGTPEYEVAALGGRARANLLLGNYAEANNDAAAALGMDSDFSYDAVFNNASSNWIVTVTTANFNKAAGLQTKWWDQIVSTDGPQFMLDPRTGEPDPRRPVNFENLIATDNITPHYSQWKYEIETDDIPMIHADEMRLIQAEYEMRQNNLGAATAIINGLRTAVGLTPLDVPGSQAEMQEILLDERFAELFMEGQRATDLWRFGLNQEIFQELNDPERPPTGRPIKFPMSDTEANLNNNIENDLLVRCLPTT